MADWLVAETVWRMEATASEALSDCGYNCYQPRFRECKVVRGRKVWIERFLLGRYLLVELIVDYVRQLVEIAGTRGIAGILKVDERPLLARAHEVSRLRGSEIRGYVRVKPKVSPTPGTQGYIMVGPFYGFPAKFESRSERGNDNVLVNLFGRLTPIELETGAWEPS